MVNTATARTAVVGANERPLLPYEEPTRTWAGHGTGALCNFCGETVKPHEIEYEVELVSAMNVRNLHFHFNCYRDWETQA